MKSFVVIPTEIPLNTDLEAPAGKLKKRQFACNQRALYVGVEADAVTDFIPDDQPVAIGDLVRINHYNGVIKNVKNKVESVHPLTQEKFSVSLANPLYEIDVNTSELQPWVQKARQVWCPNGTTHLMLFRDEFEKL